MSEMDIFEKQKSIISKLFLLPNKFQTVWDQVFAGEMTLRQWLLTAAVAQCGDTPPTLGKAAELMGSSHQNVKQLASKLQKCGFLSMEKDEKDMRTIRLTLTDKSRVFWERRQEEIRLYFIEIFRELSEEDIEWLYDCINKLYERISKIENVSTK
ncbi:MAG: MarR family transcriptional regulator [Bacillota bacterium]|nr:MarR family transcriptional regulator [Bacillota bacterium]